MIDRIIIIACIMAMMVVTMTLPLPTRDRQHRQVAKSRPRSANTFIITTERQVRGVDKRRRIRRKKATQNGKPQLQLMDSL